MAPQSRSLLILIGMMGSGKSTIGRHLARQLGLEFIDGDRALEERSGVPVATIFEMEGEEGFRRREAALLDELTQRQRLVLATGGGAVLLEENRERMRDRGLVIYLEATLEELQRRLRHDKSRPLLRGVDIDRRVAELLAARAPFYRQCAHLTFASGAANPKRLVQRILASPEVSAAFAKP
jgi:shikimate kinase